jgi:hypothetical protein
MEKPRWESSDSTNCENALDDLATTSEQQAANAVEKAN